MMRLEPSQVDKRAPLGVRGDGELGDGSGQCSPQGSAVIIPYCCCGNGSLLKSRMPWHVVSAGILDQSRCSLHWSVPVITPC